MQKKTKQLFPFDLYRSFVLGDMTACYLKQPDGHFQFTMVPADMESAIAPHRRDLNDTVGYRSNHIITGNDSLVAQPENMAQFQLMQDAFGCHAVARNGESANRQQFVRQEQQQDGTIVTIFADDRGLEFRHTLSHRADEEYFVIRNTLTNRSGQPVELGAMDSFTLGMLSPFHADNAPDQLKLHRWHSFWSGEGREEAAFVEDYELTCSWTGNYPRAFRFGQRSSMVVQEYFPSLALEDTTAGVVWAVQLAAVTPWQMVVSRSGDFLTLAGGHPDFEFANFRRVLQPGESFTGIDAVLTCVKGDVQEAMQRLTRYPVNRAEAHPASEEDLPVIFNEFCSTWGDPSEKKLLPILENLKQTGIGYFVLDAGWFRDPETELPGIGDWQIHEPNYPGGFDSFMDRIRENGMIPGIWFEFENVSANSELFRRHPDWLIRFEGRPYRITADRYFLDFRKKEVTDYLDERVIGFLKAHRIGYMKVDYNAKFQFADTPRGSASEGAREVLESVRAFYCHLRRELPELVLEICSSGGFRLSAGWLRIGDMASFSDCHESVSVPLIAAQTTMQIPFVSSQVWATLRKGEEEKRTVYQLASGFLGRLCVSGDGADFSGFQKEAIRKAAALYRSCADILKNGVSHVEKHLNSRDYENPKGYQTVIRRSEGGCVVVVHCFEDTPETLKLPVQGSRIAGELKSAGNAELSEGMLTITGIRPMSGFVFEIR